MKKKIFLGLLVALTLGFTACNNIEEPKPQENIVKPPYTESFSTNIGKFTTYNTSGEQVWTADPKGYMQMTGYVSADKSNHANEDWLISPKVDLSAVKAAKMSFEYNLSFFADFVNEATVWISENYDTGAPSTAKWVQLPIKLKSPGNYDFLSSSEISLTAYAGKKITVAFKYLSTDTKAGTWRIKNFQILEGEAAAIPDITGDGTKTNPFSITEVIILNPQSTTVATNSGVWVKGFIVGYYNSTPNPSIVETANFTGDVNLMLAEDPTETDKTKMVCVQLPAGDVRTALGLKANPTNFGREVMVYGDIMLYNNFSSVKNTSAYWWIDTNTGIDPPAGGDFTVPEMSIAELRTQWAGAKKTLTDKKKIVGVVITDLDGANSSSLNNLTITSEDNTAGIMVRLDKANTYKMGDVIEIALEGLELNHYGQAIQLNNVPTAKTRSVGTATVTPRVTTIADIRANYDKNYESTLVTVVGTVTSGGGGTWYSGTASGQNNTITKDGSSLIMYVTKYATFKATAVPVGEKSITGIVGQYSTTSNPKNYQFIMRNLNDIK